MPSCGYPEKSAGLRLSLIFPTAAPTHAPFICHRQRSRVLPGTRVPRFKNFTHKQKIQAPQKRCLYFWQGQKDLNPRHAVLEWDAVFRISTRSLEARVGFSPYLRLSSDTQKASISRLMLF